jgi:hypothetical protein
MKLARWASVEELPVEGTCFVEDSGALPESLAGVNVVLRSGGEERVGELLARGAERVLLGDLALLDSTAVQRLIGQYGAEHIGIWVATRMANISWTLAERAPNAGFKCMEPSVGVAGWDVLKSDGTPTGAGAEWWVGQMLALGATMALIAIDMNDDDLNICAGLILKHGNKLWFTPRLQPNIDLEPWVRWGQVRQLVLPAPNERDDAEMARVCEAAMVMVEDDVPLAADGKVAGESAVGDQSGEESAAQV